LASTNTQSSKVSDKVIYWSALIYAVICAISIASENFLLLGLPIILAIVLVSIYRMDLMLLLCVALTPFSLNLQHTSIGIGVSLPSEPLMFGLLLIFLSRQLYFRDLDRKLLLHPVSLAILIHLFWMLITSVTSTMP